MTIFTPWPEHQNPRPSSDQTASAPYNFVPLPEKVISAVQNAEELPDHDSYDPERLSGYFDVTLTTRSPLYIRGPVSAKDFPHQENPQIKNKPEFFHTGDERTPVIPGSSLRGMLRGLLEIVSYGKMQWVSEKQLFFRTVDDSAVGLYYNRRMVEELSTVHRNGHPPAPGYHARVEGGFFRVRKDGTSFIEECTIARIDTLDILKLFGLTDRRELYQLDGRDLDGRNERNPNPNQTPNWLYQHREIWAEIDKTENDYFFQKQFNEDRNGRRRMRHPDLYLRFRRARNLVATQVPGKRSGKLVLTGHMNHKHLAFLFIPIERLITPIEVPNDPREQDPNKRLVDRFHDGDQLTQWQTKAFPVNRLPSQQPQPDGHLRDGDPIFFLRNANQELVFFGRAQMFRLPYEHSPFCLVDPSLRSARKIDYAEALFGFVRTKRELEELGNDAPKQGEKGRAYASRVVVTDGVLQSNSANIWLADDFSKEIEPRILATPKPTAFQHYLTQQYPNERKKLDHYDSTQSGNDTSATTIRGHKLYWHQGLGTDQGLTLEQIRTAIKETAPIPPKDKQHTCFKPLKPGVAFSFRVHFENLSARELGALCWTLHPHGEPGQRYCHHLGMGKPLGMGAVELHAQLHIIDRPQRYGTLFSGDKWQLGDSTAWSALPPAGIGKALKSGDLADPEVLTHLTQRFEEHLLHELNPDPSCTRLAGMRRIAMLLKLLEWPGYRAVEGDNNTYLTNLGRPNTRYMNIRNKNEYRSRPVLPDPTQFDTAYFENKSRPQISESMAVGHASTAKDKSLSVQMLKLVEQFPIGRVLQSLVVYANSEQGVEVRFWNLDPKEVIGFIPKERIDRNLGPKISGIVTGSHREPNGRLIVDLKLRPR